MQSLTAAPRDDFMAAQVMALLVASELKVSVGVDLLDANLAYVDDLTPDCNVTDCHVKRDNYIISPDNPTWVQDAAVHGSLENLTVSRLLAWGKDRVRPYMVLSSGTTGVAACRFNLGVYLLMTPDTQIEETPQSWQVTGYEQTHILQDNIGDSRSVLEGANVLTAVRTVLATAGITAPVLLDSAASASVLAATMTWPLTSSSSPTWLLVVNDLLKSVAYQPIWCDPDGAFRSGPYVAPADRPPEWLFKVGDLVTGIVAPPRSVANDLWGVPNWWSFIANGLSFSPEEGNGLHTVQNIHGELGALSSQDSLGRIVHAAPVFLDAVDQASLEAQGNALVATATRVSEVITAQLGPFPLAWHMDVSTWSDPALGAPRKVQCRSWDLPLIGANMTYILETV